MKLLTRIFMLFVFPPLFNIVAWSITVTVGILFIPLLLVEYLKLILSVKKMKFGLIYVAAGVCLVIAVATISNAIKALS